MRLASLCTRHHGFTLIEVIVSVVLIGILFVVGTNMLSGAFFTSNTVVRETLGVSSARYALERMGREIREAQTVIAMSGTSLSFTKGNGEAVTLARSGNSVLLGVGAASQFLVNNVNAFGLVYRDNNLAITGNPSAIRFVDISLTIIPLDSPDATPALGPSIPLSTRIAIRAPT